MEPASTAATLRFVLLEPPSTVEKPSVATVELADVSGEQKTSVDLAVGLWAVIWVGRSAAGRLELTPGSSPSITLETVSGRCSLKKDRCIRQDAPRVHSLAISEPR